MEKIWIRDSGPGMEKIRIRVQVSGINIQDSKTGNLVANLLGLKELKNNQTLCEKVILG
jgi:hypothetical protein